MSDSVFRVLLVGAGEINFGSVEGPWNHSLRLEQKLDAALHVVGLVDVDAARAGTALASKARGRSAGAYAHTRVFTSLADAAGALSAPDLTPQLIVLGIPPGARGTAVPGRDAELAAARLFPHARALLVEKPLGSGASPETLAPVARGLRAHGGVCGVGYVMRYLKAVQKMKEIISENKLTVMGTNARYVMAYEYARKLPWWDKTQSGGPIIEQATHFCDLSRYLAGSDADARSIAAHTVEHDAAPGALSALRCDEQQSVPSAHRVPRLTHAAWTYESGAVGALTHVVALHGTTYDTQLDVYADGYHLQLVDVYGASRLYVRRPGSACLEEHTFPDDDPFLSEISAFVDAAQDPAKADGILSSYEDAIKTYEMTWHIRQASDAAAARRREEVRQVEE